MPFTKQSVNDVVFHTANPFTEAGGVAHGFAARLGGVSDLMDPQIDGEALQVMEMEVEGLRVLLGQGLAEGGQIQFLRQAFDKVQIQVVIAHEPLHRSVYIHVVVPQNIQTALHLIHNSVVPFL